MAANWFRADIGSAIAERVALLAAIASTGRTFGRGLMPRTLTGQALATGLTGSVNYGLAVTSQSALWAGASAIGAAMMPADAGGGQAAMRAHRTRVRVVAYGTYLATAVAARPLARLAAPRPGESVARGLVRSYLQRTEVLSAAGLLTTGLLDVNYSLFGENRATGQRRLVGTALTTTAGTALAIGLVHRERTRRAAATDERPPALGVEAVGAGVATAVGLTVLGKTETWAARGVGRLLPDAIPPGAATAVGHAVCLGALGFGIRQGVENLYRSVESAGSAMESLHALPPTSPHVSGGPASGLDWSIMSREGRRFAALPLSRDEIGAVMGAAEADPVRVFVPLAAADSPEERARIAVEEMQALGAFDRAVVVLCSPTGTGYINYVMAESVEYLTRGDCAVVSTQYSLRPSFLSLDRVSVGRANANALLRAVRDHVASLPEGRPRLLLFGESLGAHTAQDVALHRGVAGFAELGIDRALFIGTPDESGWAQEWRADPTGTDPEGVVAEVDSFEALLALPGDRGTRARIVLITHDEDPITKFGMELAIRQPPWLDEDRTKRPAGIPPEMDWRPLVTFFVTVADILNSMTVVPGQFGADGHDYRADLARFVTTVYGLPCTGEELARIEAALRARELQVAESRLVADQITSARQRAESTLSGWGVAGAAAEQLIADEVTRSGGVVANHNHLPRDIAGGAEGPSSGVVAGGPARPAAAGSDRSAPDSEPSPVRDPDQDPRDA